MSPIRVSRRASERPRGTPVSSVLWWPVGHSSNHFETVLRGPFTGDVTEDVVKGAALAIKDKGLLDLGYKYINLYVRA